MGIEWFRDLILCILGVITIAVLIIIAVLVVSIFRKSQHLMATIDLICDISKHGLKTTINKNVDVLKSDCSKLFFCLK